MADYKELIRKAIQALPENNGAARRAVYEKARAALVGQLRGLNPPLAARDITQHRLQLEDCIRQVEQEASEAVIAGLKQNEDFPGGGPAGLPPPSRQPAAARGMSNGATRPLALPNGGRAPVTPASRSTASPPPRPSTISATPRPAAPAPAASRTASRSTAPVAVPRVGAPVTSRSAPPTAAAPNRSPAAARPSGRAAVAAPRAQVQPEGEPETIEDIIAAAENGVEPVDFDMDQLPEAIDDQPEPPMFRLEQRQQRKPAAGQRNAERQRNGEASRNGGDVQHNGEEQPRGDSRPLPAIVARAEAAKAARSAPRQAESPRRANGNSNGYRSESAPPARQQLTSRQQPAEPIRLPRLGNAAMSSVREVDLEAGNEGDPQIAIERAIATLEREARNDGEEAGDEDFDDRAPPVNGRRRNGLDGNHRDAAATADAGFARAPVENERGGGSAVTIFLLVFLVLLVAAGGGGFWAWHEGFIDFDAMFGKSQTVSAQTSPPVD